MKKIYYSVSKNHQVDAPGDSDDQKIVTEHFQGYSDVQIITTLDGECATVKDGILTKYNIKDHAESLLTYADRRKREYPPAADYLDAIVKGDQAQIQKYIDDCKAVKAKYPKPI